MNPVQFYKCLADDTRLQSVLLVASVGEVCVCDLMTALQLDQPKISRHLAALRKCQILLDERRGKWVFYRLHPELPEWTKDVIEQTRQHNQAYLRQSLSRLSSSRSGTTNCC